MVEAIVFDMDGVLFDTQKIFVQSWFKTAEKLGIKDIDKPAYVCIGQNRADTNAYLKSFYGEDFDTDEFQRVKVEFFKKELHDNGVPVMKGARELLEYLRNSPYKVALASSSRKEQVLENLRSTGLEGDFDIIVTGDMVEHSKPSPDIYLKACELLNVAPKNAIAVEDSYNGLESAYAAGMLPVMIPDMLPVTDEIRPKLYKVFDSLLDMKRYLKET